MSVPWYGICPEHGVARMEPNRCRFCDAPRVAIVEPERYNAMQAVVEAARAWKAAREELYAASGLEPLAWAADRCIDRQRDLDRALAHLDEVQP